MIKKIHKIILYSSLVLFFSVSFTQNVNASKSSLERYDFEKLSVFPEYAKSLIKLKYFDYTHLSDEQKAKVDKHFSKRNFKNRLKMLYDLHLYGEAIITPKEESEESYYNILGSSLVEANEIPTTVKGTEITQVIKGEALVSIVTDTRLFPNNIISNRFKSIPINKDNVTFLRFYNSEALYKYLIQSCKEDIDPNDISVNRYCIDTVAIDNSSESLLSKKNNQPSFLQQMYWNTKTNMESPLLPTIKGLPIEYDAYNDKLEKESKNIKKSYIKEDKKDQTKNKKEAATVIKQARDYLKVTSKTSFSDTKISNRLKLAHIEDEEFEKMKEIIQLCQEECNYELEKFNYDYIEVQNNRQMVTGGLGFLLELLAEFSVKVVSSGYQYINKNFTNSAINAFTNHSIQIIWQVMRNINNVLIILLFLAIIFSQLTGIGISNYTIKKILPKLVVFVILINISYYLMLFAIDISNILGKSLFALLNISVDDISNSFSISEVTNLIFSTNQLSLLLILILMILNIPFVLISFILSFILIAIRTSLFILLTIFAPFGILSLTTINFNRIGKIWWNSLLIAIFIFPLLSIVNGGSILAFKLILEDDPSGLGYFMPVLMLFAVQSFGVFFVLKSLTKLPLIASIPFLASTINQLNPLKNIQRAGKATMALGGKTVSDRYKSWRENNMANNNSKFFRYQSSQAKRSQQLKQKNIFNNLSNEEAEFILRNGSGTSSITSDKNLRNNYSQQFGASVFDKNRDISVRGADHYLAALERMSVEDGNHNPIDINLFLQGMVKAKRAGASESELKLVYQTAIENFKADNNFLAVAELEANKKFHGGIANFDQNILNDPEYISQREKSIKDVMSNAPIVKFDKTGQGNILGGIKSHMISDEQLSVMRNMYQDTANQKYDQFRNSLDNNFQYLDPTTQDRLNFVKSDLEEEVKKYTNPKVPKKDIENIIKQKDVEGQLKRQSLDNFLNIKSHTGFKGQPTDSTKSTKKKRDYIKEKKKRKIAKKSKKNNRKK